MGEAILLRPSTTTGLAPDHYFFIPLTTTGRHSPHRRPLHGLKEIVPFFSAWSSIKEWSLMLRMSIFACKLSVVYPDKNYTPTAYQ